MYNKNIFKRCFSYKGKDWFYNIKEIPTYIKQMRFLMKHGYDMYACWETIDWFIHTSLSIIGNTLILDAYLVNICKYSIIEFALL